VKGPLQPGDDAPPAHPHLRLVWSRPADMPPPPPRCRVDLALAIERHLDGLWGLTDESFAIVFATQDPEDDAAAPGRAPRAL
jgi:hypothetical protein